MKNFSKMATFATALVLTVNTTQAEISREQAIAVMDISNTTEMLDKMPYVIAYTSMKSMQIEDIQLSDTQKQQLKQDVAQAYNKYDFKEKTIIALMKMLDPKDASHVTQWYKSKFGQKIAKEELYSITEQGLDKSFNVNLEDISKNKLKAIKDLLNDQYLEEYLNDMVQITIDSMAETEIKASLKEQNITLNEEEINTLKQDIIDDIEKTEAKAIKESLIFDFAIIYMNLSEDDIKTYNKDIKHASFQKYYKAVNGNSREETNDFVKNGLSVLDKYYETK